jgi:YD repeat-containing protein
MQNLRGLSDTSCDFASSCNTGAVLNDGYDYDANGNVAAISDGRTGNAGDRTMTCDALDRLTQVVAPGMFGTATYSYDVLDNLTRTKVTGGNKPRDHYYCYDATWRLATVRTGSCTRNRAKPGRRKLNPTFLTSPVPFAVLCWAVFECGSGSGGVKSG